MSVSLEILLQSFGIKKVALLAGFIGSVISLRFFEGLKPWEKVVTALGGAASANYCTDPVIVFFTLADGKFEGGVGFVIGLFGMSIFAAIAKVIRETNWAALLRKKLGGE